MPVAGAVADEIRLIDDIADREEVEDLDHAPAQLNLPARAGRVLPTRRGSAGPPGTRTPGRGPRPGTRRAAARPGPPEPPAAAPSGRHPDPVPLLAPLQLRDHPLHVRGCQAEVRGQDQAGQLLLSRLGASVEDRSAERVLASTRPFVIEAPTTNPKIRTSALDATRVIVTTRPAASAARRGGRSR